MNTFIYFYQNQKNKTLAGIYIHIPFCKQACHYCDFHFSTAKTYTSQMVETLIQELVMRKKELKNESVETIYFGGGTPSILSTEQIKKLLDTVYHHYQVIENPEITLEANPDDLSEDKIYELSQTKINRLSIGIQSFFEEDLQLMNRAHNTQEAENCLQIATKYFKNITLDLIYGIPNMSVERWQQNIQKALDFNVPHISCYALTVEPKTALQKLIQKGVVATPSDEVAQQHFQVLKNTLESKGFVHYELSNFGKEGFFSVNNSNYWKGKKYLGIGPSAHSFNGKERSWNVSNNQLYMKSIQQNQLPFEKEILTPTDLYNELVMTGLRTMWGISLIEIEMQLGKKYRDYLVKQSEKFIQQALLILQDEVLKTTPKGLFLTDGISSDLFMVN